MEIIKSSTMEVLGNLLKSLDGTEYKLNYCGYEYMLNWDTEAYMHIKSKKGNHEIYIRRHDDSGKYRCVTPESISDEMSLAQVHEQIRTDLIKLDKIHKIERLSTDSLEEYNKEPFCNHSLIIPCGNNVVLASVDNMCIEFSVPNYITAVSNFAFEDSVNLRKIKCGKHQELSVKSAIANAPFSREIELIIE